jgi:hypothetical protein
VLHVKPKKKKCSECPTMFKPFNSMHVVCCGDCGIARAQRLAAKKALTEKRKRERMEREDLKRRKEALKSKSDWMKEAQAAFNAWVRERDFGKPCISCGSLPDDSGLITGSRIDAGHYRSRGAMPSLRFEPLNCHAQCVRCNRYLSGNVVEFRIGLMNRIGLASLNWLEGPHEPKNYTIEDLKRIKNHYNREARRLKREREERESFAA